MTDTPKRCGDCDVEEGQLHISGCDQERCPFCGGQLISCNCCYEKLGIDCSEGTWAYENGLTDEQSEEWDRLLKEKGLIPFIYEPFSCDDCGVDTRAIDEFYMVENDIWQEHGSAHFLCIGCLENRLGRTLRATDFMSVVDREMSPRLRDRLSRLPPLRETYIAATYEFYGEFYGGTGT